MGKTPKVSVCVITYNHDRYIRQCLQSIVDQETDFSFEVIIGEDCSTDGTRGIVHEFTEKYPDLVRPIYHETNIGGTKNLLSVYNAAQGYYIAHMDGDDYMLPSKLQLQVDELDKNPDCTMCFHEMKRFDPINKCFIGFSANNIPFKNDINYLLMHLGYFAHSSKMFRAECHKGLEVMSGSLLDSFFHVHHALTGNLLYLNKPLGVYRLNVGVSTNNKNSGNAVPELIDFAIEAIEYAKRSGVESTIINKAIAKAYFNNSYNCLLAKNYNKFKIYITKSIDAYKLDYIQAIFAALSIWPGLLFLLVRLRAEIRTRYWDFATRFAISKNID